MKRGRERFHWGWGNNGLKTWLGKIGRAWLGTKKFIRGFYVWVIKNNYDVKNCLC